MAIATGTAIAIAAAASAGGGAVSASMQSRAARQNARDQAKAGTMAALSEERINKEQLDYARSQDDREYQSYLDELTYNRSQDAFNRDQLAAELAYKKKREAPFHNFAVGSLGQLQKPIAYTRPAPGTLGALAAR